MTRLSKNKFTSRYGAWAVVTGASDGIGRAFSEQLAERGLKTVLVARRLEQLEQLAHSLEKTYASESLVLSADLSTAAGLAGWTRRPPI